MSTPTRSSAAPVVEGPRLRPDRRRQAALLLLAGLVAGLLGGLVYGLATTGSRHASAYLVVAPAADPAAGSTTGDASGATTYAKAYAEVAAQPDVLDAALAPFATDGRTVDDVAADVTVAASQDAPLLTVSAAADDAERARRIAGAAAEAVVDYLTPTAASSGYAVRVLTPAAAARSADGLSTPLTVLLGGVVGLVGAGAVLVLRR
ncbi:hypothetical protein [Kineococcus sp. SYSU DK001]|uniref:hypothetical protein n=1 Tax=Kineococcus sp. SYSU DK001 TaxID=3383122 RepID=UPI003D7E81CB